MSWSSSSKLRTLMLLLLVTLTYVAAADTLTLFPSSSRAKCLDGSSAGYYYTAGSGSGSDKFLIYLQGGGSCSASTMALTLGTCYKRSLTTLGSSKDWPKTYTNNGLFSAKEALNPLYYNWNKVYVPYCDGLFFQGSSEPVTYGQNKLYFRGYDIMTTLFSTLQSQYGLNTMSTVVLSGGSAGAIGSMSWSQYLRNQLPTSVQVFNVPDSGYFPFVESDGESIFGELIDLITNNDRSIYQPEGCPYLNDNSQIKKCMFMEFLYQQIPVPVFITNSLYDQYTLQYLLGVDCVTSTHSLSNCSAKELALIDWLHEKTLTDFKAIQAARPDWGIWTISCILHVFSQTQASYSTGTYAIPQNSGFTVAKAMQAFINNYNGSSGQFTFDSSTYPNNLPCNGYSSTLSFPVHNE